MAIRVAINGYGRIGRNILRALYESGRTDEIQIVAVNDLGDAATNAHLTQYDTAHGRFPGTVEVDGDDMVVNGDRIKVCAERDPSKLPWGDLGIDVVHESTGFFTSKEKASAHLAGGAKKVIISAPGGADVDGTIVYGVNHDTLKASDTVISNASCTTNCLAPVVKVVHENFGIDHGMITTIHDITNTQVTVDAFKADLRRARSGLTSLIPTTTGSAKAIAMIFPELEGKLNGHAVRVPLLNGSLTDAVFELKRAVTAEEVNAAFAAAATGSLQGILGYETRPLVSCDYTNENRSCVIDAASTMVVDGTQLKVYAWYDNEWGYSSRMADLVCHVVALEAI